MSNTEGHLDQLNPNPDQVIWRYLDLSRFFFLLEESELYFSRFDLLGDPFEGSVTRHDLEDEDKLWMEMSVESGHPAGLYELEYRSRPNDPRKDIFVSCWHMSKNENIAMWTLYSGKYKGIAISTTVGQLNAFMPKEGRIRRVQYLDYKKDRVLRTSPVYCKRIEFDHEREVRAVIPRECEKHQNGLAISVNINELINEIRLSPEMPEWLSDLIRKMIKRFSLSVPIRKSELDNEPTFNWYIEND